jgi:aspartyl-tRNA(Asn)/glutamyl-tRNA(Gln) amidotransferase subunit A
MMHSDAGHHRHREYLSRFTAPINRIGLPSLAAPIATDEGLPFSVQLIAPMWREDRILAIAKRFEEHGLLRAGIPPPISTDLRNGRDGASAQ